MKTQKPKIDNGIKPIMDQFDINLTTLEKITAINKGNLSRIVNNKINITMRTYIYITNRIMKYLSDEKTIN